MALIHVHASLQKIIRNRAVVPRCGDRRLTVADSHNRWSTNWGQIPSPCPMTKPLVGSQAKEPRGPASRGQTGQAVPRGEEVSLILSQQNQRGNGPGGTKWLADPNKVVRGCLTPVCLRLQSDSRRGLSRRLSFFLNNRPLTARNPSIGGTSRSNAPRDGCAATKRHAGHSS